MCRLSATGGTGHSTPPGLSPPSSTTTSFFRFYFGMSQKLGENLSYYGFLQFHALSFLRLASDPGGRTTSSPPVKNSTV